MAEYYNLNQAAEYLGISQKALSNYTKIGGEISYYRRGRGYVVDKKELDRWKTQHSFNTVSLTKEDYQKCLDFAVRSFYKYRSTVDFLGFRQRGIGKWIEDFIPGKLGEIAVKKFLKDRFDLDIKLDFSLREDIPAQDIMEVAKPRRGTRAYNPAQVKTSIKSTKVKNVWLVVPQKEFEDPNRRSDVYILTRTELPLNHVARIIRTHKALEKVHGLIPAFKELEAEVAGFTWSEDLAHHFYKEGIPGTGIPRPHYALSTGELRKSRAEWSKYISML